MPLDSTGMSEREHGSKAFRDLVGRQLGFEPITDRGLVELGTVLQRDDRGDELSALGIGEPDDVRDGPAGDLGDGAFHLGGSDVGARRLDHRAAAADEVHEAVGVGSDEIAGVEPAVGVEALLAAALVVPLHHVRSADAQLPVDEHGFEAGRRLAERSAPVFGLVGFVLTDRDDTAGFSHAEHGVPQLGICRPHLGRHDRVQVSAPHGRQVAAWQTWVTRQLGDPRYETVGHRGLFGLEQIKRLGGVGGVGAHQRRACEQGGQHRERDAADPEER